MKNIDLATALLPIVAIFSTSCAVDGSGARRGQMHPASNDEIMRHQLPSSTVASKTIKPRPSRVDASSHARLAPIQGAVNFRDLGGYEAADGRRVRWEVLYRSDALDSLTAADQILLGKWNIAKITDFRSEYEVRSKPDRLPPNLLSRHVRIGLNDLEARQQTQQTDDAHIKSIRAFDALTDAKKLELIEGSTPNYYVKLVRESKASYSRWLHGLLEGDYDSVQIFHCTGGADRTGIAAALVLLTLGVPRDTVVQDYLLTNHYLFTPEGIDFLNRRSEFKVPLGMKVHPHYLELAINAMEEDYGSVDNYVREGLGIDDTERELLRARYLE